MRDFIFLKSLNLSWVEIHLDTKRWLAVSCRSNRGRWCGWFLVNWFDDWSIGWPVKGAAVSAFINKSEFWLVAFRGVFGSGFFEPADSGRLLLKFKLTWEDSDAPDEDFRRDESGCSTISRKRASDVDDCDPKYISGDLCPFSPREIGHGRTGGFNKLSRKIPMVQFILYTCIQSVSESSQEKLLTLKEKMNFNLHKLWVSLIVRNNVSS